VVERCPWGIEGDPLYLRCHETPESTAMSRDLKRRGFRFAKPAFQKPSTGAENGEEEVPKGFDDLSVLLRRAAR
jgi:hypothetical protein